MKKILLELCASALAVAVFLLAFPWRTEPSIVLQPKRVSAEEALLSTEPVVVPVLVYHSIVQDSASSNSPGDINVSLSVFKQQMQYLKDNGYTVVPMQSLVDHFLSGTPLPPRSVVLNFDDGWKSQYENALPVLESYGYTATFFIYTKVVGDGAFMNWDQIRALDALGMGIGGHSETHPDLTTVPDDATLQNEIAGGKGIIEAHLGKPISVFAYPYGKYDARVIAAVQAAGYEAARGLAGGTVQSKGSLLRLHGIEVSNNLDDFRSFSASMPVDRRARALAGR